MLFWVILVFVIVGVIYVRVAPTDPEIWHQPVEATENKTMMSGAIRVVDATEGILDRFDQIARAAPNTHRIAGAPEEGRVTYESRTRWMQFPDYITAEVTDGQLRVFGRLRFGRSDLGVNKARIEKWLSQL